MAELLIAAESIVTAAPPDPALSPAPALTPGSPGFVLIEDGWITAVGEGEPPRTPDEHLDHGVLVPGFVDLQVNGYYGVEFDAVDEAGWRMVAERLPETGTTAFVPTFITAPLPQLGGTLKAAAHLIEQLSPSPLPGHARILGVHVEGPFINPLRGGAHNKEWMTDPTPEAVSALLDAAQGHLTIMTLAPERPGALAAIRQLAGHGVLVSVGHSDALAWQVAEAADAGARMVTHLFNGQRPLHHREPGVAGQALADHRLTSGLIADFRHVAAPVCRDRLRRRPGPDRPGHRRRRSRRDAARAVPAGRPADRAARRATGCRPCGRTGRWPVRPCGWTWRCRTWSAWASACPRRWPPPPASPRT